MTPDKKFLDLTRADDDSKPAVQCIAGPHNSVYAVCPGDRFRYEVRVGSDGPVAQGDMTLAYLGSAPGEFGGVFVVRGFDPVPFGTWRDFNPARREAHAAVCRHLCELALGYDSAVEPQALADLRVARECAQ